MKTFRAAFFLLFIACVPCFAHHMAVVTSKQNAVTTMTAVHLGKMFRTETKKWPDGKDVVLVLHKASPGEAITLQHLNRMTAKQWQTWVAAWLVLADGLLMHCLRDVAQGVQLRAERCRQANAELALERRQQLHASQRI